MFLILATRSSGWATERLVLCNVVTTLKFLKELLLAIKLARLRTCLTRSSSMDWWHLGQQWLLLRCPVLSGQWSKTKKLVNHKCHFNLLSLLLLTRVCHSPDGSNHKVTFSIRTRRPTTSTTVLLSHPMNLIVALVWNGQGITVAKILHMQRRSLWFINRPRSLHSTCWYPLRLKVESACYILWAMMGCCCILFACIVTHYVYFS